MTAINTAQPITAIPKTVSFRWTYIAFPAAVLVIVIVMAAVFYGRLPQETAYRFSGGVPVSRLERGGVVGWALGLQLIFVFISLGITLLVSGAARRMQLTDTPLNRRLLSIIGNVVALPQGIIAYATLEIFLYNIYGQTLPPLWAFSLLIMLAGGAALAVLFARTFAAAQKLKKENMSGSKSDAR